MNINYVKKNFVYGIVFQITSILLSLVLRKYLVDCLGLYLLGVDGVFSNLMSLLKLLDFGVASSGIHFLYKSLSKKNQEDIEDTYLAYRKLFRRTAIVISLLGAIFLARVDLIVNINGNNRFLVRLILFIHILQVVIYYLIVCPRTALECDQKRFVTLKIDFIVMLVFAVLKYLSLKYLKNYVIYLFLMLLESVSAGYLIKKYFDNHYSINYKKEINKNKVYSIEKYGKTMIITSVNSFVYGATDNIVLSKMVNTETVGLMSNYYMIVSTINMFSVNITNSFTSTITHEINKEEKDNNYLISLSMVACYIIATFVCDCLLGLTSQFIGLYYGSQYIMDVKIPLLMVVNVLVSIFQTPFTTAIVAMGLGKGEAKFSFLMMLINLSISVYLCYIIGASGVLIGTVVANSFMLCGRIWVVYRNGFRLNNETLKKIFFMLTLSVTQLGIILILNKQIISIWLFIIKGFICVVIWFVFVLPITRWKETKIILDCIKKMIFRKS